MLLLLLLLLAVRQTLCFPLCSLLPILMRITEGFKMKSLAV